MKLLSPALWTKVTTANGSETESFYSKSRKGSNNSAELLLILKINDALSCVLAAASQYYPFWEGAC